MSGVVGMEALEVEHHAPANGLRMLLPYFP
jgi:hypothetical protein